MKTNKEKFKELTTKKKIEYIWDYYKVHIIGGIVALFILGEVIRIATAPPAPTYGANIAVAGKFYAPDEVTADLGDQFIEELDTKLHWMQVDWEMGGQMAMAMNTKLMAMAATKEVEGYLIAANRFEEYGDYHTLFYPLDTVPELAPVLAACEEQLVYGTDEDGKQHVYGIRFSENEKLEGVQFGEPFIYAFFSHYENEPLLIALTNYLFAQ